MNGPEQTRARHGPGFLRDEKGAVALLMGLLLIPLMAGLGLVLDGGLYFYEHRGVRNAADAAALAGAEQRHNGNDVGGQVVGASCVSPPARAAVLAACSVAQSHGYPAGEIEVYVLNPPHHVNPAFNEVEVIIRRLYNPTIMTLVGVQQLPVVGLAVAGEKIGTPGAVLYALDDDACAGLNWTSSGGVYVFGGGIIVNSSASDSCTPSGAAFKKSSTSVICIDNEAGSYVPGSPPPYGCDGQGGISVVGNIDCPASGCNVQSNPPTVEGDDDGAFSGDPLAGLPGPDHVPCGGSPPPYCPGSSDPDVGAPPNPWNAFTFCDNSGDGIIDSAHLNAPLDGDSRASPSVLVPAANGCVALGSGGVLPTSPNISPPSLPAWGADDPQRFDVCNAPEDEPVTDPGYKQVKPGIFWGGIYNSGGCRVRFKRGIYVIAGQDSNSPNPHRSIDLDLPSGGSSEMRSGDIILFVTSDPAATTTNRRPPGPMFFGTAPGITMSLQASTFPGSCPPPDATFEGILLFVTRTASRAESTGGSNDNQVRVQGGGLTMSLSGVMYDVNGEFQGEGSFQLLNSKLIFNVIDMQMSGDTIIQAPCGGGAAPALYLLR